MKVRIRIRFRGAPESRPAPQTVEILPAGSQRKNRRWTVFHETPSISWLSAQGEIRTAKGRVLNVSESGMGLELPEEPESGSQLWLRFPRGGVDCFAAVRHSHPTGGAFVVGVEFEDDLRWTPPSGAVTEPIALAGAERFSFAGETSSRPGLNAQD